jgi:hypothetical protein
MVFKTVSASPWETGYKREGTPYGFLWNTASSSPTLTRCDANGDTISLNTTSFDNHPLWGRIKRCQLTAAGVATYGSDNKGTGLTTTSNYMMVEIPQAQVINWTDGDYRGFALADAPFYGEPVTGVPLASVPHHWFNQRGHSTSPLTKGYVGAYKASGTTSAISSKSGVAPLATTTMAAFETAANSIGTNWGITNVWYQSLLQLLMYTEFGSLNIQSALAPGFTVATNTAPQTTGTNDSLMGTNGTGGGTSAQGVNYRGINNPYGDLWEFRIGYNSTDSAYNILKRDGSGTIAATLASGSYEATSGIVPLNGTTNISGTDGGAYCYGYASKILDVDPLKLLFIPSALVGSETTYLSDYFYSHQAGISQTGCLIAGGRWAHAGTAGPGCLSSANAVSSSDSDVGARLEFLG